MKIIIKEGEKDDSVRRTFECADCGCVFTSDEFEGTFFHSPEYRFYCACPWCHSEYAYEKE